MLLSELMTSEGIAGHNTALALDEVPKHDLITFLMSCDGDVPQTSLMSTVFIEGPPVAELTAG